MRGAPLEFFALVDELMEKYCSDSFFAHSSLLEMLGNMADILTIKTSPNKPIIPFDDPIVNTIYEYRKRFHEEYIKLFFV